MNTYLLTWNHDNWDKWDIDDLIEKLNQTGVCILDWSCGVTKSIQPNDRLFLIKLGKEPKGIFASGYAASNVYKDRHWRDPNKTANNIFFEFEILLNPEKEKILEMDVLKSGVLSEQHWSTQSSGISIKPNLVEELEKIWFDFNLKTSFLRINPTQVSDSNLRLTEGTVRQITSNKCERNPHARKICIEKYGTKCSVCCFDFEKEYGVLGKGFIHVHHIIPISDIGQTYQIDPINDLRPVCPNCHSMLHRENPPLTIEELKIKIRTANSMLQTGFSS